MNAGTTLSTSSEESATAPIVATEKRKGSMKVKGLRWYIISLIALATVINYIDRSAINIMWPYIYKDFGIADVDSKKALALITTFFMIAYAFGQTVMGNVMDKIGTRIGMVISIGLWSIATGLHALASRLFLFNIFRALLGFSEAGNWPGATKNNAEWFPAKERSLAQGIFGTGASLGGVIAYPIIAYLVIAIGWKGTFAAIGVLGLLWIIPWLIVNKATPDKHPWLTKEEADHILTCEVTPGEPQPAISNVQMSWKELLQYRTTWGILLARFFIDPVWWLFVTWLPTFMKEYYHFDLKQIGGFTWIPYVFAALGGLTGGAYAMRLIRSGACRAPQARNKAITIGGVIMLGGLAGITFFLGDLKDAPGIALALISAILFGFQFLINNLQTLPSDYYNGKNIGTVSGMSGTAAVAGTLILTWLVPAMTQTSYVSIFALGALLVPLAWLSLKFIITKQYNQNRHEA
jgi:ACS family hexuronate transporter-like MFS transporter